MATLSAQIQSLIGSTTVDENELDQWCEDAVRELINIFPQHIKEMCYTKVSFTSQAVGSEAETIHSQHIGNVFAENVECRQIHPKDKYKASSGITAASTTDPVYYIEGSKINVLPAGANRDYYIITDPNIDASSDADGHIANFPNEAEYLIPLYASIKWHQNKMGEMHASIPVNSDQDGSYTATNASGQEQGWERVRYLIETEEDSEMSMASTQSLTAEMQQFMSEYQWHQSQQQKLQLDYDRGIQMLLGMPSQKGAE